MPTYVYECPSCQSRQEVASRYEDKPAALACSCGGLAPSIITGGADVVVKGRPFEYDKSRNIPNMGRFVRSDQQQDRLYQTRWNNARNAELARRRSKSKKSDEAWQHVGRVPLEAHESVVENLRDKECWQKDPETLLKKTGFWFGD